MLDFFQNIGYFLKYDILKLSVDVPENFSLNLLHQKIKIVKLKEGGFVAESLTYPNLYASGATLEELREAFYDTTLTYFDIPRYYAKRRIDDFKLELDDGTVFCAKTAATNNLASA